MIWLCILDGDNNVIKVILQSFDWIYLREAHKSLESDCFGWNFESYQLSELNNLISQEISSAFALNQRKLIS